MSKQSLRYSLISLALMAAASSASASDGVLEINQTCAETGCFEGDSPGFPVTITSTGKSYVLTSGLNLSSSSVSMIEVRANRITLDLGGFAVSNSVSTGGTADVIQGSLFAAHATIRNGTVRGGSGQGLDFSSTGGTRVENMLFLNNGGGAAHVGNDSIVRANRVTSSLSVGGAGIKVGQRSEVSKNVVEGSLAQGILAEEGCTISGNTVSDNNGVGIRAGDGANIFENTVYSNDQSGIHVDSSSRISGNNVYDNESHGIWASYSSLISDNLVTSNTGAGIIARAAATLIGNSVSFNTGYGLDLTSSSYRNNNILSPDPGIAVVGGIDAGGNICDNNTTCP